MKPDYEIVDIGPIVDILDNNWDCGCTNNGCNCTNSVCGCPNSGCSCGNEMNCAFR